MQQSTYINHRVRTKEDLSKWIQQQLGWPLVTVELTPEQYNMVIDDSIELYTKYASFEERPLALNLNDYVEGEGFNLSGYNISAVYAIESGSAMGMYGSSDTIFNIPNAMLRSGSYPFFNNSGGGWVTMQLAHEFIELSKRMTGGGFSSHYDIYTQRLKLYPDPKATNQSGYICISCEVLPDDEFLYGNEYVKRIALAKAKILLGIVRKKFDGVPLLGGAQIDTSIGDDGKSELDELIQNIRKDEGPSYGMYIA